MATVDAVFVTGDGAAGVDAELDVGLLAARTSIPPVSPGVPPRPALDAQLDDAVRRRLTVVSAGPGWGKTTAVAQWAAGRSADPVHWLTLDPEDDRPSAFWRAVLYSIQRARGFERLHAPVEVSATFLRQVYRTIAALTSPVTLVLDDFQVIRDPKVLATLAHVLRLDVPLRLVVVSRSDPRLPLARLRVDGQLSMVVAEDLALDAPAVRALGELEELCLTPQDVEDLLDRTEGWAVGVRLQMMAAAAGQRRPLGPDRSAAEYLVAEVLDRHSASSRDFLLRTSVTSPLSTALAEAIVPGVNARARFEGFVAANEFVTPVDPGRRWYRYHPILREMLRGQLQMEDRSAFLESHRRAARWLAEHGEPVRALDHAVESEDPRLFGELFVRSAGVLLAGPDRDAVVAAGSRLHLADVEPDVGTELNAASAAAIAGRFPAAAVHVERARTLLPTSPEPEVAATLIEVLAAWAARGTGDQQASLNAGRAAVAALDSIPWSFPAIGAYERFARHQLAVALAWTGHLAAARTELSAMLARTAGPANLVTLSPQSCLAFCLVLETRIDEGVAVAERALGEATVLGWESQTPLRLAYAAVALGAALRGDEDSADRAIAGGLAADAGEREPGPTIALRLLEVLSCLGRGRVRGARIAWEAVQEAAVDTGVPPLLRGLVLRSRTELGQLSVPVDGAPLASFGADGGDVERVCVARSLLRRGRRAEAFELVWPVVRDPDAGDELDPLTHVEALLTLAECGAGGAEAGGDPVLHALSLAEPHHLVRPFVTLGREGLAGRIDQLLGERDDVFAVTVRDRLGATHRAEPDPLVERLTERELGMLAALPTMMSNVEIAAESFVSVNTVKAHLKALYRKLGVASRRDAVRRGRELGLIR